VKVLGYVRCSTAEQAVEGMSLQAQRSRIASWCEATGAELVEVIEDGGVSGTRPLTDRPGGARVAQLLATRNPMLTQWSWRDLIDLGGTLLRP
jgi:DNA invertase Pin-like site-specific DNA recombinase